MPLSRSRLAQRSRCGLSPSGIAALAVVFATFTALVSAPASASADGKALLGLNVTVAPSVLPSHYGNHVRHTRHTGRAHCPDRGHYRQGRHQDRFHSRHDPYRHRGHGYTGHITERRARRIAARHHGLRVDTSYRRGNTWVLIGQRANANPYGYGYGAGGHQSDHARIHLVLDAYSGELIRLERRRHGGRHERHRNRAHTDRWYDDRSDHRTRPRRDPRDAIQ